MSWRPARSLSTLQRELDQQFPRRIRPDWLLGDPAHASRPSDHNPRSDGVVCAIDVRGATTARALWDHLLKTRDPRVKYMIHAGKVVSATTQPWVIRPYRGTNPHTDHLHLSVGRGPDGRSTGPVDDTASWGLLTPPTPTPAPPPDPEESTMVIQHPGGDWHMVVTPLGVFAGTAKSFRPAKVDVVATAEGWKAMVDRFDAAKQLTRIG